MDTIHCKTSRVKIFADGADKAGMLSLNANPLIQGMTTNPTLMSKAGIKDYEAFARDSSTRHPGQAHLLRGVLGRIPRDAPPGAEDRVLAKECLREDPHHQHPRRIVAAIGPGFGREGVQLNVTAILTLGPGPRRG